jgi:STE24 endopeptidase
VPSPWQSLDAYNPRMNPSFTLTLLLAIGLLAHVALKLWLNARQVRHVAAHRDAVPQAYARTFSLNDHRKAADYTLAKARLSQWDIVLDAAMLLGWTLLGGLDALNQWLLQWMQPGLQQQLALVVGFVLIGGVIGLPLSLVQTFGVEQRFGFNKTTPGLWLSDLFKGLLLGAVLGLPLLALVLWLMDAGGSLWWLWAWGALVVWQLFLMAIAPNVIMPMFNKFTPLEDESLKERVLTLMQRAGFQARGFFVMDGSRRSAHSNAFFTGFGASKRVVFFDTLLQQLSPAEMEAVLAHELGHFKHRHIFKMMAVSFATTLGGLALLGWLAQQAWFYTGLGVLPNMSGSNSALALVLFMAVVPVFSFFLAPLSSWRSRVQEFEADAYAISQTPAADLASALLKLYQDNASTLTPDPLFVKFYYSHPPASERLARMLQAPGAV